MVTASILRATTLALSREMLNMFFPASQNYDMASAGIIVLISSVTALGTPHTKFPIKIAENKTAKNANA